MASLKGQSLKAAVKAAVGVAVVLLAVPALAAEKGKGAPMVMESLGGFFVGGTKKMTDYANAPGGVLSGPDEIFVDQMYVEKWEPRQKNKDLPAVVFLH